MPNNDRHYFLDWLRIIAFFILILFHTAKYYAPLPWHIQSPEPQVGILPYMMATGPWRLALLFMISGVASAFILGKTSPLSFIRQRSLRLLVPLGFGIIVVIPPQFYYEVIDKFNYTGSYLEFLGLYLTGYGGFCGNDGKCLFFPDWNHLWFLGYLWVYSVALAVFAATWSGRLDQFGASLDRMLTGWRAIAIPALTLAILRVVLAGAATSNIPVVASVFYHANYFVLFVVGVLLARQAGIWKTAEAQRWVALGIAVACWAARVAYFSIPPAEFAPGTAVVLRYAELAVFGICAWSAIMAAVGFAHRHLNVDNGVRRYMTQAVFPIYILHQTVIIALAFNLRPFGIPAFLEGPLIALATTLLCLAAFEGIRRIPLLRPLFGLAPAVRIEHPRDGIVFGSQIRPRRNAATKRSASDGVSTTTGSP